MTGSRRRRRVALITGAGRGIGFATAQAFLEEGWAVVVAERVRGRGRTATRRLKNMGGDAIFNEMDVAQPGDAERTTRRSITAFGAIDCLVNNAGVIEVGRLERLSRGAIREIVRVNLLGPQLMARAVLPHMRRRRRGTIINVSSLLGKEGIADYVTYCSTKWGLLGMTEALADELRGSGVRTYAVCPTAVDTPLARNAGVSDDEMIPPEHVARVIVALATGRRRRPSGSAVEVTA